MEIIKCKHCSQVISLLGKIWYDSGLILRYVCTSSPTGYHEPQEPEKIEEEIKE